MVVPIFVISGPSGCGKSTVSKNISDTESFAIIEGDDLHPPRNVEKMSAGHPLTDDDRWDWLNDVRSKALELAHKEGALGVVLTCSSLKKIYRDVLKKANEDKDVQLSFIFLNVEKKELIHRMETRSGHYMKKNMLESQLADLELPKDDEEDTYVVDAMQSIPETTTRVLRIVAKLLATINKKSAEKA